MPWAFWRRDDRERLAEFDEHLRSLTELYLAEGVSRDDAVRRARLRFGNPAVQLLALRDLNPWNGVRILVADLWYAVRVLRRSPAFALAAAATLALGIGATTAVFSVVDSVLLRPLPYPDPDALVGLSYRSKDPRQVARKVPSPVFLAWSGERQTVRGVAAYITTRTTYLTREGVPVELGAAYISPTFFPLLDPGALAAGRFFTAAEANGPGRSVVLVRRQFARRFLGPDDALVGHAIRLRGNAVTVVGLIADAFRFPGYDTPDVYAPIDLRAGTPTVVAVDVIGRLRPGVSTDQAAADLDAISRTARPTFSSAMTPFLATDPRTLVVPLAEDIAGDLRSLLLLALGAVSCILLIACANVAGLFVARVAGRERELAVRAALGASPGRLAAWLVAESVVLSALGAALGLLLVVWGLGALRRGLAGVVPHAEAIAMDGRVAAWAAGSLFVAAVGCASIPVLRLRRRSARAVLKLSSTGTVRESSSDRPRRLLVAAQVAMALTLVVAALLLATTLWRLSGVSLGFDDQHLLTAKITARFGDYGHRDIAVDALLARVRALPEVSAAGATSAFPLSGHAFGFTVPVAGEPPPVPIAQDATGVDVISPGYLEALRVKILDGRAFDARDTGTAPPVALVNAAFAHANLHGRNPVGAQLGLGGGPAQADITIVGLVDDVKDRQPGQPAEPAVYRPFSQAYPQLGWSVLALAVRTPADSGVLVNALRRAIADVVPGSVVYDEATMENRVGAMVAPERLRATVFAIFAATAVVLCVVGLYGLLATAVADSRQELGVRLALGASRHELIGLTLRRAVLPTGIGILLGCLGGAGVARLLADRLFGVSPLDATIYLLAAGLMVAVAILAAGLPAYRASTVDPVRILRAE
jgi:putative ABC transport system permease protein